MNLVNLILIVMSLKSYGDIKVSKEITPEDKEEDYIEALEQGTMDKYIEEQERNLERFTR